MLLGLGDVFRRPVRVRLAKAVTVASTTDDEFVVLALEEPVVG